MLGILLHQLSIPPKRTKCFLLPYLSFSDHFFAGTGKIEYETSLPGRYFRSLLFEFEGSKFATPRSKTDFHKLKFFTGINIKDITSGENEKNQLLYSFDYVTGLDQVFITEKKPGMSGFHTLSFQHDNPRRYNPYSFDLNVQAHEYFVKGWIETQMEIDYRTNKKGLEIRLFAGKFLYNKNHQSRAYDFNLSGWAGTDDYLYDHVFLGRFESPYFQEKQQLFSQQFIPCDGGFKVLTSKGSNDWLIALNLISAVPGKLPVRVYGSLGSFANVQQLLYETGIEISIIHNIFAVYFPVVHSGLISDNNNYFTEDYWERIRFTLQIEKIKPIRLIKDLPIKF